MVGLFLYEFFEVTLYTAAVYVITTLGARQPIIKQCFPTVGHKRSHTHFVHCSGLQIEI